MARQIFGNSNSDYTKMKVLDSATEHKFADNEKCLAKEEEQRTRRQENIDHMQLWSADQDISFNKDKVHGMHFGPSNVHQELTRVGPSQSRESKKKRTLVC